MTKRKRTTKNNGRQNTTQKTKDRATQAPLKTNNDVQNTTQKTKDRATQTLLTTGDELKCYGMVGSFCSSSGTRRVILVYT
jgi:hypothetical protein